MGERDRERFTWGFEGDSLTVKVMRAMYGAQVRLVREHAAGLNFQFSTIEECISNCA